MTVRRSLFKKNALFFGFLACLLASVVFLILSFLLPVIISANYYEKSLDLSRKQAQAIKDEFAALLANLHQREEYLAASPFPENRDDIFRVFEKVRINPQSEGIAFYDKEGEIALWLGNVINVDPEFPEHSRLIRSKASVYLVSSQKTSREEYILHYRLLAFLPQFKTPHLREYHFFSPKFRKNCDIFYWDFMEDVSGFEKIFLRHNDEYIGQPRFKEEIQTIFFPLRDGQGRIIATVNLSSPSLSSYVSGFKDNMILVFLILSGASLLLLAVYLALVIISNKGRTLIPGFLFILTLIVLRGIIFPLSRLEKIESLPIFSPAAASFLSIWNLAKSPADIFLTFFFLFLIIACLAFYVRAHASPPKKRPAPLLAYGITLFLVFLPLAFLFSFQKILSRLLFNSNIHILRFSFNASFFLLHMSILLLFVSAFLLSYFVLKRAIFFSPHPLGLIVFSFAAVSLFFFLLRKSESHSFLFMDIFLFAFLLFLASSPRAPKRMLLLLASFFLGTAFVYASLHHYTSANIRSLVYDFLRETILSQQDWAEFLVRQSFPEFERRKESVMSLLRNPYPTDLARSLWEKTLAAKFNWYSSLEILDEEGDIISRFSLNVPKIFRPDALLPFSQEWTTSRLTVPSLGREKEFIVGYKDWQQGERYLGRMILSLSIDQDMLPFLYSANPYFELLRVSTLPSLNQYNIGFQIFDERGKLLFNPNKISMGISPDLLTDMDSPEPIWTSFEDKNKRFDVCYFQWDNRIYGLLLPQKSVVSHTAEFLKLFFFYLSLFFFLIVLPGILSGKIKVKTLLWSFSNRVYAAFIVITLISLLLFSFFTRRFFHRVSTQRFVEKAQIHATFARNVMEDFIFLQQEENVTPVAPPDDLVLWISSTIGNDVNLYAEGKLVSSSRREFTDSGLLPELIDGEIYYRIQQENRPFFIQRQKIGAYSFQTLTIPYFFLDALILISLPFPFEQQEIAQTTEDLVEFLVLVSAFFIGLVILFSRSIGRTIIGPVKKLLAGTREVSLGNLEISIEHASKDEMKTLIDGFNAMIKSLKSHQQELAEMSKKVAWAEMARKVAHEVKNPLTPIQLSAEHLLKVYEEKRGDFDIALKESASYIISEVENLRKIAQEFLEVSREVPPKKELFDVKEIIRETISPYQKIISDRISFRECYEGNPFPLDGDKSKMKVALRNIIINSIEAITGKGEIEIHLRRKKEHMILAIIDSGPGIDKDILERIFDPYFSTKDVGTGLGLPIARKIIEDHGGTIQAASESHKGTKITITLPLPPQEN